MNKIKVLLLVDTLETYGGAEKQILELAKNLNRNLFTIHVCSLIPGGKLLEEIESYGAVVKLFPVKKIYSIPGILRGFSFKRYLMEQKIDILMTYHFSSDIWGAAFGRIAKVPVIISNRRDIGFWRKKRHIGAYRRVNRWVNTIVVNSLAGKNMVMQEEAVSGDKIKVVYNGVDLEKFKNNIPNNEIKNELGISENDIVIGSIGNLHPVKGQKYLIEAVKELLKEIPDVKLLLVGEGKQREELGFLIDNAKIKNRIVFLGSRTDIPELLSVMDVCVLPSLSEGLSNAILEYMAAEKPIVATNAGGNPELIENGITGILVEPGNSNQLKDALGELIRDRAKAQKLAKAAKEKVEFLFAIPAMVKNYEKLFKETEAKTKINQIKVLHLISSSGLFGAEKVVLHLANIKNNEGINLTIGAIKNSYNPHIEIINAAQINGNQTKIFDSSGKFDLQTIISIRRFIKENSISIIHTHNYKSDIIGFFSVLFLKTRWIATNHVWHNFNIKLKIYNFLDAFLLRFTDKIITVSDEIKKDLIKSFLPGSKIEVIYNGIDTKYFKDTLNTNGLKKKLGINEQDIVISNIGRLSPEKGHEILIKAVLLLVSKISNIKLLIIGDGFYGSRLKSIVNNLDLNRYFIFTGIRNDIPEILSLTDIYVNSSFVEGLPITILEAMASGKPIVATKVGANHKVVRDNLNGFLVEAGNPEQLFDSILKLATNETMRKNFGKNSQSIVENEFSSEKMISGYRKVYQEVVSNSK